MSINLITLLIRIVIFGGLLLGSWFDYKTQELKDEQIRTQQQTIDRLQPHSNGRL
jgi:hypothetical protein